MKRSYLVGAAALVAALGCGYGFVRSAVKDGKRPYVPVSVEQVIDHAVHGKVLLEAEPVSATMDADLMGVYTQITVKGESGRTYSFWGMRWDDAARALAKAVNDEANDGDLERIVVRAENGIDGFIVRDIEVGGRSY
ncbi:MAG: hypothetical protein ABIH41_07300 [Nanoarchaeota archaeon]